VSGAFIAVLRSRRQQHSTGPRKPRIGDRTGERSAQKKTPRTRRRAAFVRAWIGQRS
jgi:hypothetical protein